jgi:hypothetical protein
VRQYVLLYPLPGLAFPVGLLVLSFGLFRVRVVSPLVAALLALGAILFPIGRIGGIAAAVIASDVALSVAMGLIGWRVLRWTAAEWERVPTSSAETVTMEGEPLAGQVTNASTG